MSEDAGLYSASARAFFERQQRRRHEEQLHGDRRGPAEQPPPGDAEQPPPGDLDQAVEHPDAAIGVPAAHDDGPPGPAEVTVTHELGAATEPTPAVRYRARVVSDDAPGGVFAVQDGTTIGRSPDVDIRIDHPDVSRHHAQFTFRDDLLTIVDLGSTNGTAVNEAPLQARAPARLTAGDTIQIGSPNLQLQLEEE